MSDNVLKIKLPNFNEPSNEYGFYEVLAEMNGNTIGSFHLYPFDRYNFIDQTEYDHEDFCYFARRLELYERPYLNDDGLIVMVVSDLKFDARFNDAYKVAFLKNSIARIAQNLHQDVADIYAISLPQNAKIYENASFEAVDKDELYGIWLHYAG